MSTKTKVARSKTQGKAAKAPAEPAAFKITRAAFDGGEGLRADCTPADLFSLMFEAPNGGDSFLADVLRCAADEFELLEAAQHSDHPNETMLSRVCLRANWRIKVAIEVNRRMQAALMPEERS